MFVHSASTPAMQSQLPQGSAVSQSHFSAVLSFSDKDCIAYIGPCLLILGLVCTTFRCTVTNYVLFVWFNSTLLNSFKLTNYIFILYLLYFVNSPITYTEKSFTFALTFMCLNFPVCVWNNYRFINKSIVEKIRNKYRHYGFRTLWYLH